MPRDTDKETSSCGQASSWVETTRAALHSATFRARGQSRGRVEEIGDGVAMISGLPDVRLDEVLRFEGVRSALPACWTRIGSAVSCWTGPL